MSREKGTAGLGERAVLRQRENRVKEEREIHAEREREDSLKESGSLKDRNSTTESTTEKRGHESKGLRERDTKEPTRE